MNTTRFIQNFRKIKAELSTTELTDDVISKIAIDGAIKLEELEFKDREISMLEEKSILEMELAALKAKSDIKYQQSESIKSIIQGESMLRSVMDNGEINRLNSYVSFLNVVGNASQTSAIASHSNNVVKAINDFNTSTLDKSGQYSKALNDLKDDILSLLTLNGTKEISLYTPKLEIEVGEVIKIRALSVYGNEAINFFIDDNQVITSKTLLFSQNTPGDYKVTARNSSNSTEDTLYIKVIDI